MADSMSKYILSPAAQRDIESILAWTYEHFGQQAGLRYEALLTQAILDVAERPARAGSHLRADIAPNARTYHLSHSKSGVTDAIGRVKRPRHFLLYRSLDRRTIEIGRVLHESMDLARHLPEGFGPGFQRGEATE